MKLARRWITYAHRYLGIALGLLVMMWFVTGIVMMYAGGMPRVMPQARLERLEDLDLTQIHVTPAEAAAIARDYRGPGWSPRDDGVRLATLLGRPVYRVDSQVVFADTGEPLTALTMEQSRAVASRFAAVPEDRLTHAGLLRAVDQWTLQARLPLHKFRAGDESGTEVYVHPATGEVAALTTRRSRALAWIGVIPHWFYFTALREHQTLWYRLVVWSAAAACLLAVLGLVLAVLQFRRTRPFRLARAIPYTGFMRWHYVLGALFGLFTLTWAFSGLLSMEPFAWTNASGLTVSAEALNGGPVALDEFSAPEAGRWDSVIGGRAVREIGFARILDQHYYVVRLAPAGGAPRERQERLHQPYYIVGRREPDRLLVHADTLQVRQAPLAAELLLSSLERAVPDAPIVSSELLTKYDSYYYSRREQTPLPVLRVKFGDPAETWLYVDPDTSQVLAAIPRLARLERWLYNGLHSLDFAFWYNTRPLWDIGMLALLLGGLATASLGVALGIGRVRRAAVRVARSTIPSADGQPRPPLPDAVMQRRVSASPMVPSSESDLG